LHSSISILELTYKVFKNYVLLPMTKNTKSMILIIFSMVAFYVYQFVVGVLVLALAVHTFFKE